MLDDRIHYVSQAIAVFCIIFGAVVCTVACAHGQQYEAAKVLGATIAGAGVQAFTSQYRQTLNNNKGSVNVDATTTPTT